MEVIDSGTQVGTASIAEPTVPARRTPQSVCGLVSLGMAVISIALIPFIGVGSLAINAAGVLLAIFGFFEADRRQASAWWGLIVNSGICVGCGAIATVIAIFAWTTFMALVPFMAR